MQARTHGDKLTPHLRVIKVANHKGGIQGIFNLGRSRATYCASVAAALKLTHHARARGAVGCASPPPTNAPCARAHSRSGKRSRSCRPQWAHAQCSAIAGGGDSCAPSARGVDAVCCAMGTLRKRLAAVTGSCASFASSAARRWPCAAERRRPGCLAQPYACARASAVGNQSSSLWPALRKLTISVAPI